MKKNKIQLNLITLIFFIISCGIVQIKHEYKGKFRTSEEIEKLQEIERNEERDNASWTKVDKNNIKSIKTFLTTVKTSKYKSVAINRLKVINSEIEKIAKAKGPHKQETNDENEQGESVYLLWSKYYGFMNWSDAKQKCEANNMRLPTKDELGGLYENNLYTEPEEAWPNMGCYKDSACNYWSSDNDEEVPNGVMLTVLMSNGTGEGRYELDNNDVRCIQLSEQERRENLRAREEAQKRARILSKKTIAFYHLSNHQRKKILKRMLKKTRKKYMLMGYHGTDLKVVMAGAKRGISIGLKQFDLSFLLKKDDYLIWLSSEGLPQNTTKYKIKKNKLYVQADNGNFKKLGFFKKHRKYLVLLKKEGLSVVLEKAKFRKKKTK